ncbi:uncharacterized protein BDZ83DRAFT_656209 [Colletotrichum acutatum]|uniref:Uncharacterized protein n=1 Tax=Glomerella acutata TaxID=27357 RepID=A0AAD8U966_GLOAC|nr:uncharacterized protein BDZ83DRAFT_656209 [Colletotrichum acutatum]KAK1713779.1 hypothetical protein BDZ83DRAFT_656209 [Colletotrichum acutatum]
MPASKESLTSVRFPCIGGEQRQAKQSKAGFGRFCTGISGALEFEDVQEVNGRQPTHVSLKYTTRLSEAGSSVPSRASPQIISRTLLFQCSHPPTYPPELCSFLATISWENLYDTLSPMRQTPGTTPLSLAGPLPLLPVHFTSIHARPSLLVSCPLH